MDLGSQRQAHDEFAALAMTGVELETKSDENLSGKRILVVDDSRDAAEMLASLLELMGSRTES